MKNPSLDLQELLKDVKFFILANSFEELSLWSYWHNRCSWVQGKQGLQQVIGYVGDELPSLDDAAVKFPINVSFTTSTINGHKICFYEPISRYADFIVIEKWLQTYFPVWYDNRKRRAMTDAQNFHLCMHHINSLARV